MQEISSRTSNRKARGGSRAQLYKSLDILNLGSIVDLKSRWML
jgi:hypothetical protein